MNSSCNNQPDEVSKSNNDNELLCNGCVTDAEKHGTYGTMIVRKRGGNIEHAITEYAQVGFVGGRQITVNKLDDGTYFLTVQNPPESDRGAQHMWLTEESMLGLMMAIGFYYTEKGESAEEQVKRVIGDFEIKYTTSDNIGVKDEN